MDRCNELCTKARTGTCALCDALEERDRFIRLCMGGFLLATWARLADTHRAPLRWWWPPKQSYTFVSKEEWKRQHDETSIHINRLILLLITFSFFCLLSLGAPDSHLLSYKAVIQLPFVNTPISFRAFLFIGPLILITVSTYLHVFVGYHQSLGIVADGHTLPFIFNMQNPFARWLTGLILYCCGPLVLLAFGYKASPRPEGRLVIIIAAAYAAIQTSLALRRWPTRQRGFLYRTLWLVKAVLILIVVLQLLAPSSLLRRPLNLFRADLAEQDLYGIDLSKTDLRRANLQGANLERVNLRGADLRGAKLDRASLVQTDLRGAHLEGASLDATTVVKSEVFGAKCQQQFRGAAPKSSVRIGTVVALRGVAEVRFPAESDTWEPLKVRDAIFLFDTVRVQTESRLAILLRDESIVTLVEGAVLQMTDLTQPVIVIDPSDAVTPVTIEMTDDDGEICTATTVVGGTRGTFTIRQLPDAITEVIGHDGIVAVRDLASANANIQLLFPKNRILLMGNNTPPIHGAALSDVEYHMLLNEKRRHIILRKSETLEALLKLRVIHTLHTVAGVRG